MKRFGDLKRNFKYSLTGMKKSDGVKRQKPKGTLKFSTKYNPSMIVHSRDDYYVQATCKVCGKSKKFTKNCCAYYIVLTETPVGFRIRKVKHLIDCRGLNIVLYRYGSKKAIWNLYKLWSKEWKGMTFLNV